MSETTHERSALEEEWAREQAQLAARVVPRDDADWLSHPPGSLAGLRLVGGLDISFFPAAGVAGQPGAGAAAPADPAPAPERAIAALAVLSFPELQVRHVEMMELPALQAPYRPGFLGFREVPPFLELLRRAALRGVHPQLLMVDGFGVLHQRRCGSASHLGVLCGVPTVGVAKTLLRVDGLPGEKEVRAAVAAGLEELGCCPAADLASQHTPAEAANPGSCKGSNSMRMLPSGGAWIPLVTGSGDELGAALCSSAPGDPQKSLAGAAASGPPASRPIFVSAGHRIGLASAVAIVQRCCKHRVPEPIRQADLLSRAEVRRLLAAPMRTAC